MQVDSGLSLRKVICVMLIVLQGMVQTAQASVQELKDMAAEDNNENFAGETVPVILVREPVYTPSPEDEVGVVIYDAPPTQSCCHREGFFCSEQGKSLVISFGIIAIMYGITYGILRLVS